MCTIAAGGKVSKIGADYVGLLVLGVFNAAIGRQNIRSDLVYQLLVRTDVIHLHGTHACESSNICYCPSCYVMSANISSSAAAPAVDQQEGL